MAANYNFRFLDLITGLFAGLLIVSNLASTRIVDFGPLTFDAGTVIFPVTYIIGDLLTEVYGYARSRRIIWIAFFTLFLAFLCLYLVSLIPAKDPSQDAAWQAVMGLTPRICLASLIAFAAGEFSNAIVLTRMKQKFPEKGLAIRFLGSTLVGQVLDTLIFVTIAFLGVLPKGTLIALIYSNYIYKVAMEVTLLPFTVYLAKMLKSKEKKVEPNETLSLNPFVWRL
ncbi:MAG: queuosine precursor transporter [Deltaproteobacteria bacterium]|nr:queuosine precursor transporter [Deltaproteobacteria bacterium]